MRRIAAITIVIAQLSIAHIDSSHAARLGGVLLRGGYTFSADELLPCYRNLLGQPINDHLINNLHSRLQAEYKNHGHFKPVIALKRATPNSAILIMYTREARIGELRLTGRHHVKSVAHLSRIRDLKTLQPLTRAAFNAALKDLREQTHLHLTGELVHNGPDPEDYVALVHIRPRSWQAEVGMDNRGLERFDHNLITGKFSWEGTRLGVWAMLASAEESDAYSYSALALHTNYRASRFSALLSSSNAGEFNPLTQDWQDRYQRDRYQLRAAHKLVHDANTQLALSAAAEGYTIERPDPRGAGPTEVVRAGEVTVRYAHAPSNRTVHRLRVTFRNGTHRYTDNATFPDKNFWRARVHYSGSHRLSARYDLKLETRGQMTSHQLPSPERFAYGGEEMGGSFDPGTLSGDIGFSVRTAVSRHLLSGKRAAFTDAPQLKVYAYADHGRVTLLRDRVSHSASSVGIGLQFATRLIEGSVEFAQTIGAPDYLWETDKSRIFFSLSAHL